MSKNINRPRRGLSLEALEQRTNPSSYLDNGNIVIEGDHGVSNVEVHFEGGGSGHATRIPRYRVVENGVTTGTYSAFLFDAPKAILFYGRGGDDIFHNYTSLDLTANGGSGNDELYGGGGINRLHGDFGVDYLSGGKGADHLYGGGDKDYLYGRGGADQLWGGEGDDELRGGAGNDTLRGEGGNDLLVSDNGDPADQDNASTVNWLYGGAGLDRLWAKFGTNHLYGEGDDDELYGGHNDDYMYGGGGADFLDGWLGNDYLDGGVDGVADTLKGGANSDTFVEERYRGPSSEEGDWSYSYNLDEPSDFNGDQDRMEWRAVD